MAMDTQTTPIERACTLLGSQAELARQLKSSPSIVNQWVTGRRPIPNEKCIEIEHISKGAVTVEELQPNEKNWSRIRDKSWPHPGGRPVLDYAKT